MKPEDAAKLATEKLPGWKVVSPPADQDARSTSPAKSGPSAYTMAKKYSLDTADSIAADAVAKVKTTGVNIVRVEPKNAPDGTQVKGVVIGDEGVIGMEG